MGIGNLKFAFRTARNFSVVYFFMQIDKRLEATC